MGFCHLTGVYRCDGVCGIYRAATVVSQAYQSVQLYAIYALLQPSLSPQCLLASQHQLAAHM